MFNRILVVCVGNICRSPMGEYLLASKLQTQKEGDYQIASAGIGALVGHGADPKAVELMNERHQIDLSPHSARQLGQVHIAESDLVLVMEGWQKSEIEKQFPHARGRVYRLGHWGDYDIPDPYRKDTQAFENALDLIEQGIDAWMAKV